jgi:uncharacterized membrane protein required for colicin V production
MVVLALSVPDGIQHMNWVDYVFLVVLVYSVVSGAWVGFFAECLSVAGVAGGTFIAGISYNGAGQLLGHAGVPSDARDWAGFAAVFLAISLAFRLSSIKARALSKVWVQGISNELAGGLLGLLVGAMICLFATVTVGYFHVGKVSDPVHNSQIVANCKNLIQEYVTMLPQKMHDIPGYTS